MPIQTSLSTMSGQTDANTVLVLKGMGDGDYPLLSRVL